MLADTVLDVPPQHYRLGRAPYLGNEGASDVVKALVRLLGVVGCRGWYCQCEVAIPKGDVRDCKLRARFRA